jgi:hypothetical protein
LAEKRLTGQRVIPYQYDIDTLNMAVDSAEALEDEDGDIPANAVSAV